MHLLFWNTWLLRPRLWTGGPAVAERRFAPEVQRRAPLVGAAVRDRFDVCALAEVFESTEQDAVAAAVPAATVVRGPGRRRLHTGSGLMTLVDNRRFERRRSITHAYRSGGDLRDSDTLATKGALLVTVAEPGSDTGFDVVSTHLIAGGEWLPVPGADDHLRHHAARMRQADELVAFVSEHRDPANALVVVGDMNVAAPDRHPAVVDPGASYRDLARRLAPLGLHDVWADHGVGPGTTSTFRSPAELPADPDEPDRVLDDPDSDPATAAGDRIDHLWLADPLDGRTTVTADRPRRWSFPERGVQGGPAGSLSDHLALSTRLHLYRS